jgi:hypothetical protein
MAVCPHGKTGFPLDRFSWNFIFEYFSKICQGKIQVWLQSDKNNGYFTWKPMHISDNKKNVQQSRYRPVVAQRVPGS